MIRRTKRKQHTSADACPQFIDNFQFDGDLVYTDIDSS
jgi:hypothetical protein